MALSPTDPDALTPEQWAHLAAVVFGPPLVPLQRHLIRLPLSQGLLRPRPR